MSTTALRSAFRVSPIFALLWEQWRVTRGVVLTTAAIAVVVDVALAVGFQEQPLRSAGEICGATALVMLMGAAILFVLTRRRPGEEMSLGFPRPADTIPLGRGVVI
ncbi:MAG: hypothetical protein HZB26_26570 [Candidatus Hydrogenedentes bacterium]|nr:hypothetical protein [Candidatus Hydrogenedentota bacterium]